ncbi:helper of Tim protein 13 [[Candida] anglica]|uniref:Helper of Tim protein 13 n=1 Tax=[Candida] anglica TaxID=148631 RepID=A0ABP0ELZ6_9ASCO
MDIPYKLDGKLVDNHTRCSHYHSEVDIIAIKFKCCGIYYPCFECHDELTNHPSQRWSIEERNTLAILCGSCYGQLTVNEYQNCQSKCIFCDSKFNPKCSLHSHLYFDQGCAT